MAINVNTVYTTVLSILNKEQRGYLTPDEFNKVATQVQLEIFEKFFEDYNQYIRMPQTDVEFASKMDHTMEEFQIFETSANASNTPTTNIYTQPIDLHRFGSTIWNKGTNSPPIEILTNKVYNQIKLSDLTQPSDNLPIAKYNKNQLTVFPSPTAYASSDVTFNYIRKPKDVRWGYTVGSLGQYIYDSRPVYSLVPNTSLSITQNTALATDGLYTAINVPGTNVTTSGNGSNLQLNITVAGGVATLVEPVGTPYSGMGFKADDTITIDKSLFGTASTADIILTLSESNILLNTTEFSQQIEISESLQTEMILEILKYAGIIIKDPQIVQAASQELAEDENNSKR
jgi:hypothetical protein|tara:strand:- start:20214 stop:21245 length:1032 start_codon:yes stop_codon:yes gene_type:complete